MQKVISITLILISNIAVIAQSGGVYEITQSVVSNGGGTSSSGTFNLEGTSGQDTAGRSASLVYQLQSGFWTSNFSPTAASVSISGRVRTPDGRGLRNAIVQLTNVSGITRITRTSAFGYYTFDEVEAGQTVVITVISRRYQYLPQVISVNENLSEIDFTPITNDQK